MRRLIAEACGSPGASAGSLDGVRVQKTLELFPAYYWVKLGIGISAELLTGRV